MKRAHFWTATIAVDLRELKSAKGCIRTAAEQRKSFLAWLPWFKAWILSSDSHVKEKKNMVLLDNDGVRIVSLFALL